MAELRLQQLNERDRLYNILNQEYEFSYVKYNKATGFYDDINYTVRNFMLPKLTNEVISDVKNTSHDILEAIRVHEYKIGRNILPEEWDNATHKDSRMIGYDAIHADLQSRMRKLFAWAYPYVPEGQPYGGQQKMIFIKSKGEVELRKKLISYLKLAYLENFGVKQMTITSTFKEKLDQEKLKSEIELQTLQAQLGIAQKSLETETFESESAKLDFQQSHTELLTFNKLINKIEELHEPEPVKTGFHLESIDAKKLLIVGLGLIGVVILLIVVKNK